MRYLCYFVSVILCWSSGSQISRAQEMSGLILDADTKHEIQGVAIVNKRTNMVALSDKWGNFSIRASPADSLLFTHTSYEPVYEVVNFSLGSKYKVVLMKAKVYELGPATIKGMTKYQQDSAANRDMFTHAMNEPITHFSPIFQPVSFIVDKILGISKRAKRFKADFNSNEQNAFIDTRYSPEIVSSQTGLKGDGLAYFMNAYPMPYDFARTANDLEIKMWVRNNYKQYRNSIKDGSGTAKGK